MLKQIPGQLTNCIKKIFRYTDSSVLAVANNPVPTGNTIIGESKTDLSVFRIFNIQKNENLAKEPSEPELLIPEEFEQSDSLINANDIDLAAEAVPLEIYDTAISVSDFTLLESEAKIGSLSEGERIRVENVLGKLRGSELLDNYLREKSQVKDMISDMLNEINDNFLKKEDELNNELADMSAFLNT